MSLQYTRLDKDFGEKFCTIMSKMGSGCPKSLYDTNCQKSIFVQRTLNKWFGGKCLLWVQRETIALSGFNYAPHYRYIKKYVFISLIGYHIGHGEEVDIYYKDPTNLDDYLVIKLNISDLVNHDFAVIDPEVYNNVAIQFSDDRPMKTYRLEAFTKDTIQPADVVLQAKDEYEAVSFGRKENQDVILTGHSELIEDENEFE